MIYLLVLLLTGSTADSATGWAHGTYSFKHFEHATLASCEAHRQRVLNERTERMLVTKCGTGHDISEFHFYGKRSAPVPPVYDEKPLPPSAPAKPDWERAA